MTEWKYCLRHLRHTLVRLHFDSALIKNKAQCRHGHRKFTHPYISSHGHTCSAYQYHWRMTVLAYATNRQQPWNKCIKPFDCMLLFNTSLNKLQPMFNICKHHCSDPEVWKSEDSLNGLQWHKPLGRKNLPGQKELIRSYPDEFKIFKYPRLPAKSVSKKAQVGTSKEHYLPVRTNISNELQIQVSTQLNDFQRRSTKAKNNYIPKFFGRCGTPQPDWENQKDDGSRYAWTLM